MLHLMPPFLVYSISKQVQRNSMFPRLILGLVSLFLCSSCVYYDVTIERFHALPQKGSGQTFTVEAKGATSPLEAATYVPQIVKGLETYGWRQQTSGVPDYRVYIAYQISDPFDVTHQIPLLGQTGGGTTQFSGTVYNPDWNSGATRVSGTAYTPPTFGVVGTRSMHTTSYTRYLFVVAKDRNGKDVLDARVTSTGATPSLGKVMPVLTSALFDGFPGKSGNGRKYLRRG